MYGPKCYYTRAHTIFSSPGRSPERAVVQTPVLASALGAASALAKC